VVDYCTGSADTSPAYSHCFPECIDADADAVVQPFFHGNAGAPGSPYARAVRFVKHDRETELRGERRELLQRAFVSIHGVDGFDRHVYSSLTSGYFTLQVSEVIVTKRKFFCKAKSCAIL